MIFELTHFKELETKLAIPRKLHRQSPQNGRGPGILIFTGITNISTYLHSDLRYGTHFIWVF